MNTTNGKIAQQSRLKLTQALFSIMQQYSYKEITITQITQEAGLARKTFYRLYSSKDDILNDFFQTVFSECRDQICAKQLHHYWEVVQVYFDFWEEKKELLMLLQKHYLLGELFEKSYQYSFEIFEFVRSKEVMQLFEPQMPYLLAYAIGGIQSLLIKWVELDMSIPSAVIIQTLKAGLQSPDI